MVFCVTFIVIVSAVCGFLGVSTSWTMDTKPGDSLEAVAIKQYYASKYGSQYLLENPFKSPVIYDINGNAHITAAIDVTDPRYVEWDSLGKPGLAQYVLEARHRSMSSPSNPFDWLGQSVTFFFEMMGFQFGGGYYILSILSWLCTIYLVICVIVVARGGGG